MKKTELVSNRDIQKKNKKERVIRPIRSDGGRVMRMSRTRHV